jgi:hypothetical protein
LTTPSTLSGEPSATGSSECGEAAIDRANLGVVGGEVEPVELGARGHQLAHRAVGQAHHAREDRALLLLDHPRMGRLGEQHVQLFGGEVVVAAAAQPNSRSSRLDEASSSHTNGLAAIASQAIGRAIATAIGNAARSASCLGTSSPTTRLR